MASKHIALSVLDLMPILEGHTISDTYKNAAALASAVEQQGYKRYWISEHHNMESIASAAPVILIGHIAGATTSLRVGSGGIMLPNHAPLVVAEQFGTLDALYPGRIDLGLGRAPGTDPLTAQALRRNNHGAEFDSEIAELRRYFSLDNSTSKVRAIPGEGANVPIWILGSSTDSAVLAGQLGLPYAFAAHFAPAQLHHALMLYREHFKPSVALLTPYVMACINVITADIDAEAHSMATSFYQLATGIVSGRRRRLQPAVASMDGLWTAYEEAAVRQMMAYTFVGDAANVAKGLRKFVDATNVDELMIVTHVYDIRQKQRSYQIVSEIDLLGDK